MSDTFAIGGFKAIAQNAISRGIASNFYPRCIFLSALGAFTLSRNPKTPLSIGRPDAGAIFSGKAISPAESMTLANFNSWQPRIQGFETSNSKWMGARDTNPTVANPTTNSHGQAMQNTALFNRAQLKTPILIWHADKERAMSEGTDKLRGLAMSQLIDEATEVAYQEHVKELNSKIWTGNPTNQAVDPWDQPLGINQALSATNVYGNVNRTNLTAGSPWLAQVDSTLTASDIEKIVDDANVTKGIADQGEQIELWTTTKALYLQFKAQIIAKGGGAQHVLPSGIPNMAQMGVKTEVLQKDNGYIMYDAQVSANNVLGFVMKPWRLALAPGKNLAVSKFVDLSDKAEGAKDADQAFVTTQLLLSCDNPSDQVIYSAIGT